MTGITDLCHPETVRVAAAHQAEAEKIAAELAAIASSGMVLPGSITQRRTPSRRPSAQVSPKREDLSRKVFTFDLHLCSRLGLTFRVSGRRGHGFRGCGVPGGLSGQGRLVWRA